MFLIYIRLNSQMSHIRMEEEIEEMYVPWADIIIGIVIFSLIILKLRG